MLKGWHLILVAAVVLPATIGIYVGVRKNEVNQRLEALRAAGYPTSFAELMEYNKLPAGAQNAATLYVDAFAFYVPPVDEANLPVLGKAQLPDRGDSLPEPMAGAIADLLAANQQCLVRLREAAGMEHCRYDWDYTTGALPEMKSLRQCAQLLQLGAISQADQGDTGAAIAYIKDGLRLSDSLRREPALINYLVRIAGSAVALGGLERALNVAPFTDGQLQDLSGALAEAGGHFDLAEVMVTERCFNIEYTRDPSLVMGSGQGRGVWLPGIRGTGLADILDYMGNCVAAARLPLTKRVARFREIEAERDQLSFLHVMVKILAPAMSRVAEQDLRVHAHLDLARTALAIERYRLATGAVPDRLEELVPQYLEQVPIDPFDGRPIRYRRTEPGYVLYSIGEDGQDSGGRERSKGNRGQPYDWCFIVTR